MKKILIPIVIIIAIVGVVALSGSNKSKSSTASSNSSTKQIDTTPQSGNVKISIKGYEFNPMHLTVKKGTKVTWTNMDIAKHNIVADNGGMPNGPLIGKGESYEYTFDTVGKIAYHCDPHPYMLATITVVE